MKKILIIIVLLLLPSVILAADNKVTIKWNVNPEPDISHYTVYYGTAHRDYTNIVHVGTALKYTTPVLSPGVYYCAVSAEDVNGNVSELSNEGVKEIMVATPVIRKVE